MGRGEKQHTTMKNTPTSFTPEEEDYYRRQNEMMDQLRFRGIPIKQGSLRNSLERIRGRFSYKQMELRMTCLASRAGP
jgi:hypothetical protein